jgi:hypothetical protein
MPSTEQVTMQKQTLFIIGAGASREAELPMARELATRIAATLDIRQSNNAELLGDPAVIEVIQEKAITGGEMNVWLDAARLISQGVALSNSIDSFIDLHKNDAKVQFLGKLAIAKTIVEAERQSFLYLDEGTRAAHLKGTFKDDVHLSETWFYRLFRNLNDGVRKPEVNRIFENVSFVVFNYDRCIEHFFYNALQMLYGIDEREAKSIIDTLRIYHPYGAISPLRWQSRDGIPYGFTTSRANLIAMASNIKTYTEQVQDGELVNQIREAVKLADTVVFLGFSYHRENMKLLSPGVACNAQRVFGTAYEISEADRNEVINSISDLIGSGRAILRIENIMTCSDLLQHFSRSLFR